MWFALKICICQMSFCMRQNFVKLKTACAAAGGGSIVCFMIRTLTFFHEISERTDIFVGRLHFALSKVDVLEDWVWLFGPWQQRRRYSVRTPVRPFEPSDSDVDFLTFKYLLEASRLTSIDICLLRVFPSILLRHIILSIKSMLYVIIMKNLHDVWVYKKKTVYNAN